MKTQTRRYTFMTLVILCFSLFAARAQQREQKPFSNKSVAAMLKYGAKKEAIVNLIQHAPSVDFDLSSDAVVELVKVGADGEILDAMKARGGKPVELPKYSATAKDVGKTNISSDPIDKIIADGKRTL